MVQVTGFIYQVLALATLVAHGAIATDEGVLMSEAFGGPHGTKYSDMDLVSPGQTVQSITIQAGERVNGVGVEITDASGVTSELFHGGRGGKPNKLTLGKGQYITGVEAHWGEKGDHTRIKFLRFTTNGNDTIEGGRPTKNIGKDSPPDGYQLGGFYGTCGKELDSVGMLWTQMTPIEDPAISTPTPEDQQQGSEEQY